MHFQNLLILAVLALQGNSLDYQPKIRDDIANILQAPSIHNPVVFTAAMRIVQTLQTSPTCNHMAALNLVNSCRSLDADSKDQLMVGSDTELVLDEIKSEYAARLAVCELAGAQTEVPHLCAGFLPSAQACQKSFFSQMFKFQSKDRSPHNLCYPEVTEKQFKACLGALQSKPQWWTSYSNARQNAVVMCQASRDAIEKDKQITTLHSLTEVASEVTSALARSIQEAQQFLEKQRQWNEEFAAQQQHVRAIVLQGQKDASNIYSGIVSEFRNSMKVFWEKMTKDVRNVEKQVGNLTRDIQHASDEVNRGRQHIIELLVESHELNSRNLALDNHYWLENIEHARILQTSLTNTYDVLVAGLDKSMVEMEKRAVQSQDHIAMLNEKMQGLEDVLDATQTKSAEMFSFFTHIYTVFHQGRNIINITLLVFALSSKIIVKLLLTGWNRQITLLVLLIYLNRHLCLPVFYFVQSSKTTQVGVVVIPGLVLTSYAIYRFILHQALSSQDGFVIPKIELPT